MTIELTNEAKEIISALKTARSYLECEKVIINNIKKHLHNGFTVSVIESYLKLLKRYFEQLIGSTKNFADSINYGYASGFVNTIISSRYWNTWII